MYRVNGIVNKLLLPGEKQPGFTYKASGLFTKNKNKERIKKLKEKVREDIFIKTN